MDQRDELRIDPNLIESLKRISYHKGVSMAALVNMAVKEFVFIMDDDLELSGIPRPELAEAGRHLGGAPS